jgi:hypothetical protein
MILASIQENSQVRCIQLTFSLILTVTVCSQTRSQDLVHQWTAFAHTAGGETGGRITLDNQSNVFVSGQTNGSTNQLSDAKVAKYDREGRLCWHRVFGQNTSDYGWAVAADFLGGCYVVGGMQIPNTKQYGYIARYDDGGKQLWVSKFKDYDIVRGVTTDRCGNAYIVGRIDFSAIFIVKLSRTGSICWAIEDQLSSFTPNQIVVQESGSVYVAGASGSTLTAIRYDRCGRREWIGRLDSNTHDIGRGLQVVGGRDVVVCGRADIYGEERGVIAIFDDHSQTPRSVVFGNEDITVWDVACHPSGAIFVVGKTKKSNPLGRIFMFRTDQQFSKQEWIWLSGESDGKGSIRGIVIDKSGDLYIGGNFNGKLNGQRSRGLGSDIFAAKYVP